MSERITSDAIELPASCKSVMEHMSRELEQEDEEYCVADISESCCSDITKLEQRIGSELDRHISLVAFEKK